MNLKWNQNYIVTTNACNLIKKVFFFSDFFSSEVNIEESCWGQFLHSLLYDGTPLWKLSNISSWTTAKWMGITYFQYPKEDQGDGFNKEWPILELLGILKKKSFLDIFERELKKW